jgi:hypothetical protein
MLTPMSTPSAVRADESPAYGPELEGFEYPWPVQRYEFVSR